ncbi:REJ domain [Popillia japonica]|uniref:REJ domain n=1 Tax=Popillia japonica TaxID=7064 RepID=A0AAW1LWY9_POPJA
MSAAKKFTFYLMFHILYWTLVESTKLQTRGTWSYCIPEAAFINCESSRNDPKILYNTLEYSLEIRIKKGCETSDIYNYWSLTKAGSDVIVNQYAHRKEKASVLISKFQLGIGNYVLKAHVRESPMLDVDVWIQKQCYLRVTSPCPFPLILGGAYRTAPLDSTITLSASATHTCSLRVEYTWGCYCKDVASQIVSSSSCKSIDGQKGEVAVLRVGDKEGYAYHISLTAKSWSLPVRSTTQIIKISPREAPLVSASCMKNCETTGWVYSDPVLPVILKATCESKCHLARKYEWKIRALTATTHPVETIMEHATYIGDDREYFIIKANWLGYDEKFEISLHTHGDGETAIAESRINIDMAANLGGRSNCTVTNNNKAGLRRIYTIECVVPPGNRPAKYRLQQMIYSPLTGDLLPRVLIYADEPTFNLRLGCSGYSPTQTIVFSVVDDTMVTTNTSFQVEVPPLYDPSIPTDQVILDMKHTYLGRGVTESVRHLFRTGRIAEASQIMNVLLCLAAKLHMNDSSIPTLRISSQNMLLLDIVATVDNLLTDLDYFLALVPQLVVRKSKFLDYFLALVPQLVVRKSKFLYHSKLRSRFCLMIALSMFSTFSLVLSMFSTFSLVRYPLTYQRHMELDTTLLHKCANYYLDDDYMKPYTFNIQVPPPIPQQLVSLEDYPNYGETVDDTVAEDLKEIIVNSIAVINKANEMLAKTLVFGQEKRYHNFTSNNSIAITYSEVKNRPACDDGVVQVRLPDSLGFHPKDTVRIIYTSLPKKAYFWHPSSANMSENIVNLKVYGPQNNEVSNFPNSIHISFKLNANQTLKKYNATLKIPLDEADWTEDFVQKHMKLFRIDLWKDHTLVTTIDEIDEVRNVMVAITKDRKPTRKDFNILVKRDNRTRYIYNRTSADCWYYVGFLPAESEINKMARQRSRSDSDYGYEFRDDYTILLNKYAPETLNITFKYGFTSVACKEWTGNDWEVKHCSIGTDISPEKMHCICSRVTVLAGDVCTVAFREEEALIIPYELTLVINPILILATIIIVGLYCIFISIANTRRKKFHIYFLSDNFEEDRYAYLLVVHTGAFNDCSTTSNVVVKLFGCTAQTKGNVLNYPDPDLRILQDGGEDWFVLTSKFYLGDITNIQIWYDAIGPRYTWYCEYMKVFDLQSGAGWFFNVSQRFTVAKRNYHEFTFQPSEEKLWRPRRKLYTYLRFYWNADNTWIFWKQGSESILSYMDKLTIGLFEIIFTIAFTLAIVGRPVMRLMSGLGFDTYHSIDFVFYYIFLSSVVTFIVFFPYSIILRYTPKQQSIFRQDKFPYSRNTSIICWVILFLIFVTSITYIIYMGFWISFVSSIDILIISAFSITLNIALYENIKVVVFKILRRTVPRRRTYTISIKAIVAEAERQRRFIYKKFGQYALRPYLTHLYQPLNDLKLMVGLIHLKNQSKNGCNRCSWY